MSQDIDVLKTLYDKSFDCKKYLYHYTSVLTAFKILETNSLKCGSITKTNDPLESKPKIVRTNTDSLTTLNEIRLFLQDINDKFVQLLCLSMDPTTHNNTESERIKYSDYSGRGLALPRMWAQYGDNNNGVCLVFNSTALHEQIETSLNNSLILNKEVDYKQHFDQIPLDIPTLICSLHKKKKRPLTSKIVTSILKTNQQFTEYNYFTKLSDWEGENEYRFLIVSPQTRYISNILPTLSAIVVGEQIDPTHLFIIKLLTQRSIPVYKISFTAEGCNLYPTD